MFKGILQPDPRLGGDQRSMEVLKPTFAEAFTSVLYESQRRWPGAQPTSNGEVFVGAERVGWVEDQGAADFIHGPLWLERSC